MAQITYDEYVDIYNDCIDIRDQANEYYDAKEFNKCVPLYRELINKYHTLINSLSVGNTVKINTIFCYWTAVENLYVSMCYVVSPRDATLFMSQEVGYIESLFASRADLIGNEHTHFCLLYCRAQLLYLCALYNKASAGSSANPEALLNLAKSANSDAQKLIAKCLSITDRVLGKKIEITEDEREHLNYLIENVFTLFEHQQYDFDEMTDSLYQSLLDSNEVVSSIGSTLFLSAISAQNPQTYHTLNILVESQAVSVYRELIRHWGKLNSTELTKTQLIRKYVSACKSVAMSYFMTSEIKKGWMAVGEEYNYLNSLIKLMGVDWMLGESGYCVTLAMAELQCSLAIYCDQFGADNDDTKQKVAEFYGNAKRMLDNTKVFQFEHAEEHEEYFRSVAETCKV